MLPWHQGIDPPRSDPVECGECGELLEMTGARLCDAPGCKNALEVHTDNIACPANNAAICEGCGNALCNYCVQSQKVCDECEEMYCVRCFFFEERATVCQWCDIESQRARRLSRES